MKIKKIEGDIAVVQVGNLKRRANIQLLPRAKIGDYVIVHAGFAIEIVNPREASETLRIVSEIR